MLKFAAYRCRYLLCLVVIGTLLVGCAGATPPLTAEPALNLSPETRAKTILPQPVPTVQAALPGAEATAYPTFALPPSTPQTALVPLDAPHGDTVAAAAVLDRWMAAATALKTVHLRESFMQLNPDGSAAAGDPGQVSLSDGIEEWYDLSGTDPSGKDMRYRVDVHTPRGEFTTLYDGKASFRSWSWIAEVWRIWPDDFAANGYWMDDIDGVAGLFLLYPARVDYTLNGSTNVDGREMLNLEVRQGNISPGGITGMQIYLDAATYLPYRYVSYPFDGNRPGAKRGVRTFTSLDADVQLSAADFKLPGSPNSPIISEPAYMAPQMPVYATLASAQQAAGVPLYSPGGTPQVKLATAYLVEQDGKQQPVISFNDGAILEGAYLPVATDRFANRFNPALGDYDVAKVDIDGQLAEWRTSRGESPQSRLRLVRGVTQIEIKAATRQQAVEIARSLMPVE